MKIRHYIAFGAFLLMLAPPLAMAQEVSATKRASIQKLMDLTGAVRIGQSMAEAMTAQLKSSIKGNHPDIPDSVLNVLPEEMNKVISENMPVMIEFMIHIYDQYYTEEDINGLVDFYSTPLGKKVVASMPAVSQECVQAGIHWGQSLAPEIDRRVKARLTKEGYQL